MDIDSVDDADFEYDDDAVTETSIASVNTMQTMQQQNAHCNSISKDLNAFQSKIGQQKMNNLDTQNNAQSKTMPRSSLALLNNKMKNGKNQLTKQSMLLIHGDGSMKLSENIIPNKLSDIIPENEQHDA